MLSKGSPVETWHPFNQIKCKVIDNPIRDILVCTCIVLKYATPVRVGKLDLLCMNALYTDTRLRGTYYLLNH